MPYGKQQDFNNPTITDFDTKATPQEKKLWEDYLKDYSEPFQRSTMADVNHFLFVCPSANLVVELEKFHHFSDSAGGVSGKKGDALREMGLTLNAYTNRELDTDFSGVCDAIDRAVQRQKDQKSLVDIPKAKGLPLEDDDDVHAGQGWKVTVSGEYKEDEEVGRIQHDESVATYGGNGGVVNPLKDEGDGYTYTHFNKRQSEDDLPEGNWQKIGEKKTENDDEAPASTVSAAPQDTPEPEAPAETPRNPVLDEEPAPRCKTAGRKHLFIAPSADIVGDVRIGTDSSVWYQAVIRGDQAPITIGDGTNVQDGCVVHVDNRIPTIIGDGVTIGHNCTIHGCDIEDNVLIGMGSTILNGAKIGRDSIVGAGSLVTQNKSFPEGSLILGSPAKVVRSLTPEEIQANRDNAAEYRQLMENEPGQDFEEIPGGFIRLPKDTL